MVTPDQAAFEKAVKRDVFPDVVDVEQFNYQYMNPNTAYAWAIWRAACKYKDETQQARCVLKIGHCGLQK